MSSLCTCWSHQTCAMQTYLTSKTFKTETYFIPLLRIHPSGHLNLWSSAQVLPSYLVLLCAPPPVDQAPALFAHRLCILVSAVARYKRFIRKRVKHCLSFPLPHCVHFRQVLYCWFCTHYIFHIYYIALSIFRRCTRETNMILYFQPLEVNTILNSKYYSCYRNY